MFNPPTGPAGRGPVVTDPITRFLDWAGSTLILAGVALGWIVPNLFLPHGLGIHLTTFGIMLCLAYVLLDTRHRQVLYLLVLVSPLLMHAAGRPVHVQTFPLAAASAWGTAAFLRGRRVVPRGVPVIFGVFIVILGALTFFREMDFHWLTAWEWEGQINLYFMTHRDAARMISVECGRILGGLLALGWMMDEDPKQRHDVLRALVYAGTAGSILALIQTNWGIHFLNPSYWAGLGRASGVFQDANMQGLLSAATLILIPYVLDLEGRRGLWAGFLALVNAAGLFATGCRAALLWIMVFLVMFLVFTVLSRFREPGWWRRVSRTYRTHLIFTGVFLVLFGIWLIWARPNLLLRLAMEIHPGVPGEGAATQLKAAAGLGSRLFYWQTATRVGESHPAFGVGPGAYLIYMADELRRADETRIPDTALNWYLQQWVDFGFLGVLLLGALWLPVLRGIKKPSLFTAALWSGWLAVLFFTPPQHAAMTMIMWILAGATLWTSPQGFHLKGGSKRLCAGWAVAAILYLAAAGYWNGYRRTPSRRLAAYGIESRLYGVYPDEFWPGIGRFRWTRPWFGFSIPDGKHCLALTVWIGRPPPARGPVSLEVYVNETPAPPARSLLRDEVQTLFIPLPGPVPKHAFLRFHVHPPWRPRDYGSPDPRRLGVPLKSYAWRNNCPSS